MVFAPFKCCGSVLSLRILDIGDRCKCASFPLRLSLQGENCTRYCGKAHLTNIPGCSPKRVQRFRRAEICNITEIILCEILCRINPTASQQHKADTVFQRSAIFDLNVQIIQLLQKTVLFVIFQFCKVVRHIILDCILRCRQQCCSKAVFVRQFSKAVFQRFHNGRLIFRTHRPDGHRACKPAFVRIRDIKVIFQPGAPDGFTIKDSNTRCTAIHPTPETLVPAISAVNRQDSGCVRTLCIQKHLLIKGQTKIVAGRGQKALPSLWSC